MSLSATPFSSHDAKTLFYQACRKLRESIFRELLLYIETSSPALVISNFSPAQNAIHLPRADIENIYREKTKYESLGPTPNTLVSLLVVNRQTNVDVATFLQHLKGVKKN